MNIYSFITREEIETVSKCIEEEKDFKTIRRKVKGYEFRIRSSKTGTNFSEEVRKGDYMIGLGFSTSKGGTSGPYAGKELDEFKNVGGLTELIDNYMKDRRIEGYRTLKEEKQLTLF